MGKSSEEKPAFLIKLALQMNPKETVFCDTW